MSKQKKHTYVVGQKQVLREMNEQNLSKIILAGDADENYKHTILSQAEAHGVAVEICGTTQSIAAEYGIEVPSACVGFLLKTDS